MLTRNIIELKFDRTELSQRQEAAVERGSEREGEGVSTRRDSVALAAAVLGNTVGGFALLAGLVLAPLWLERFLALLP